MAGVEPKPGDRISLWRDGLRLYTVIKVGRFGVTVLDTTTLRTYGVSHAALKDPSCVVVESNPRTIRRIIRTNLAERRKLGLRSNTKAAKTVLELLRKDTP